MPGYLSRSSFLITSVDTSQNVSIWRMMTQHRVVILPANSTFPLQQNALCSSAACNVPLCWMALCKFVKLANHDVQCRAAFTSKPYVELRSGLHSLGGRVNLKRAGSSTGFNCIPEVWHLFFFGHYQQNKRGHFVNRKQADCRASMIRFLDFRSNNGDSVLFRREWSFQIGKSSIVGDEDDTKWYRATGSSYDNVATCALLVQTASKCHWASIDSAHIVRTAELSWARSCCLEAPICSSGPAPRPENSRCGNCLVREVHREEHQKRHDCSE